MKHYQGKLDCSFVLREFMQWSEYGFGNVFRLWSSKTIRSLQVQIFLIDQKLIVNEIISMPITGKLFPRKAVQWAFSEAHCLWMSL